jgi:aryl-alcohol dehydrogenase-like predicted oxidoreductase
MIPMREFGKTGAKVSALGLGGHHLGQTRRTKRFRSSTKRWMAASLSLIIAGNIT